VINPRSHVSRKAEYLPTRVGRGATIGANATVICGATIGAYAFVGAGAVVRGEVPPYALMVGVPARRVGWMCRCGVRLAPAGGRATCTVCGSAYLEETGRLRPVDPPGA
jgi:UDP-2-acetamido-3-amino-2,3-dideoxy-glucuronate N-acetyltransferase